MILVRDSRAKRVVRRARQATAKVLTARESA